MTHPLIMLKLLKSLRFLILALLVFVNFSATAFENFDECALLKKEIKKRHAELSLDDPNVEYISSIYMKRKYDENGISSLARTENNNLLIESTPYTSFYTSNQVGLNIMTEVSRIDGHEVNKLSDEELDVIFRKNLKVVDSKNKPLLGVTNKKIDIEYIVNKNQKRSVTLDREIDGIYVETIPSILAISKINSTESSYEVNIKNQITWFHYGLEEIAKDVFQKLKKTPEFKNYINTLKEKGLDYNNEGFYCDYTQAQWTNMNLWHPEVNYINLLKSNSTNESLNPNKKIYSINYYEENSSPEKKNLDTLFITKLDHLTGKFQGKFNFNAFPFDQQKITFQYFIDSSANYGYPYFNGSDFFEQSNYKNLKFNDWTPRGKPEYKYIDYIDPLYMGKPVTVEISFSLDRNFEYYLLKIFLPILIILCVAWSCFWVSPKEVEARLTVSIVCLLSLIAYTFVIDKELPKLSYFTIMDYAVLLSYAFSTIPTFESIYVNRVAFKNIKKAVKIDLIFIKFTPILYLSLMLIIFYAYTVGSENIITALS